MSSKAFSLNFQLFHFQKNAWYIFVCIVAPIISFDRCSSLQWSNYINARKKSVPDFTAMHLERSTVCCFICMKCDWNGKSTSILNQQHETHPPPAKTRRRMIQSDSYIWSLLRWTMCPVAQYRLWGHRMSQKQIDLTEPQQEVEGNSQHRATSWVCHWTPATLSWPRLPHPWGYFSTGLSLMLASGTKYSTSTALAACSKVILHTRPSGE